MRSPGVLRFWGLVLGHPRWRWVGEPKVDRDEEGRGFVLTVDGLSLGSGRCCEGGDRVLVLLCWSGGPQQ